VKGPVFVRAFGHGADAREPTTAAAPLAWDLGT
jgi:hypothetical protein